MEVPTLPVVRPEDPRRLRLRLAGRWPWVGQITAAAVRLRALSSG
jgi:hypothetical protein